MIFVTGATGQLAGLVIANLIKRYPAEKIVAGVRNIEKAAELVKLGVKVRLADYEKPELWSEAFRGVERVLIVSSSDLAKRYLHHRTVINAARESQSVRFIAYTSMLNLEKSTLRFTEDDRKTESDILKSGIPYAMLRNPWYIENYTMFAKEAMNTGVFYGAAGNGRLSGATRSDLAEATAIILSAKEPVENKVYELGGDSSFSLEEVVNEIIHISNRDIKYANIPLNDLINRFIQIGFPNDVAELLSEADNGVAKGELMCSSGDLSAILGRRTITLSQAIAKALE